MTRATAVATLYAGAAVFTEKAKQRGLDESSMAKAFDDIARVVELMPNEYWDVLVNKVLND